MSYATITQLAPSGGINNQVTPDTTSTEAIFGGRTVTPVYGFKRRDSLDLNQVLRVGISDKCPTSNFAEVAYAFRDLVGNKVLPMGQVQTNGKPIHGPRERAYLESERVSNWSEITRELARDTAQGLVEYGVEARNARRSARLERDEQLAAVRANWASENRRLGWEVNAALYKDGANPGQQASPIEEPRIIDLGQILRTSAKYVAGAAAVALACIGLGYSVNSHESLPTSTSTYEEQRIGRQNGLEGMLATAQLTR